MFEMFAYPEKSSTGERVITTYDGIYSDMLMDVRVYCIKKGEELSFESATEETAILLQSGSIILKYDNVEHTCSRGNVFDDAPLCLHFSCNQLVLLKAIQDSEVLVQKTINNKAFSPVFYNSNNVREMVSGKGLCNDTAVRLVRTIFDYDNAPYSNMVMGEVVGNQGGWSSYIPHHHPQPEVYYYRFERSEGFGACFIGDNVFKIKDRSFAAIPGGLTHPQVSAPGYRLYICWMIRHFDGNPWKDRIDDPNYLWLIKK